MKKLNLIRLYNTSFPELYRKLLINKVNYAELECLLSLAIFFINLDDKHIQGLGYRIIILYANHTKDYKPLYEVSLNKGLIPIAQFISDKLEYSKKFENLYTKINSIINENYKIENTFRTLGQHNLINEAKKNINSSQIIVAPTSYGKTDLILGFLKDVKFINKKICILTPTKSLLAQTKKRILNVFSNYKIITQPEMYNREENVIILMTQERLLRLLQIHQELCFDLIILDEAHNMLDSFSENNQRSILLTAVLCISYYRNKNTIFKFLTPFIKSEKSLNSKYLNINYSWNSISENIKSEIFYYHDIFKKESYILDQFSKKSTNRMIKLNLEINYNDYDIINHYKDIKNLVYLNSPKKVEEFSIQFSKRLQEINNPDLKKAVNDLHNFIHKEYNLAECLSKGILYHHGAVPEMVRFYIEDLYSRIPELNFLITNSTLLEGVNIPATKIFILDTRKGKSNLSPSGFKNLIGRVCRFSELFNLKYGNLKYLTPEIHIVKGNFSRKNFNFNHFIEKAKILVDSEIEDEIKNPLLENSKVEKNQIKVAEEFLENVSDDKIITNYSGRNPVTEIGKLCLKNNIRIFDIIDNEKELDKIAKKINLKAENLDLLFIYLKKIFFYNKEIISNDNMKRLYNEATQNFYKMLIEWRIRNLSLTEMINYIIYYWNNLPPNDSLVYVGRWGDEAREGFKKYWVNIKNKTNSEKVNLAIVRLKEEYDFIDNELIKYIEVLKALNLISESIYFKIKYGTDNNENIILLNCGISRFLSKILLEKYKKFIEIDSQRKIIKFDKNIINEMKKNNENGILIVEVRINSNL